MGDIQESGEMYLETILILSQEKGLVRSIDVAEYMGFSKPSVSRAMGILKSHGYIIVEEDGNLKLTEEGRSIAEKIYERHELITEYLVKLGVSEETAEEDACRIEHIISNESFMAIKKHISSL
jgi:Mn-dependent DtxR family transcriptional regulator